MKPPLYPDFPKEEYEQRYARARALMSERNLDGLLITEELNYIYFTGHRSIQNPLDKIRPYVFILPKDDDGVLITMPFEVGQVLSTTWIRDVRQAGLMGHASFIASVLKEKGLANARIGAEMGREQYLGVSFNEFMGLQKELPNATFVDAASLILTLRAIKSPREIQYIRQAAQIVAQAEVSTFAAIRVGMSEIEVDRLMRIRIAELGGEDVTESAVISSIEPNGGIVLLPTERRIQPGDLLGLDYGIQYRGYCADIARTASIGEPKPEVAEFYSWMMDVRHQCNMLLRAGNTPRQVVTACREAITKRGLETMGVGRIGHGVGLQTTEYPSLAMNEEIVFEPGMVFACNPNFIRPYGFINAEDNWVITDGEPNLLSSPIAPNDLLICPR